MIHIVISVFTLFIVLQFDYQSETHDYMTKARMFSSIPMADLDEASSFPTSVESTVSDVIGDFSCSERDLRRFTFAIAKLETGNFSSALSKRNNFFGIKARDNEGSITLPSNEYYNGKAAIYSSAFAVYDSPSNSVRAFFSLLSLPRYRKVRQAVTLKQLCGAIQLCGYATDPKYGSKVYQIAKKIK